MKIAGLLGRLYRVEDKLMVSDTIILDTRLTKARPIKDSFKLYIKR